MGSRQKEKQSFWLSLLTGCGWSYRELIKRHPKMGLLLSFLAVVSAGITLAEIQFFRLVVDGVSRHHLLLAITWLVYLLVVRIVYSIIFEVIQNLQIFLSESVFQALKGEIAAHFFSGLDYQAMIQNRDKVDEIIDKMILFIWDIPTTLVGVIETLLSMILILLSISVLPWWLLTACILISLPRFLVNVFRGRQYYTRFRNSSATRKLQLLITRNLFHPDYAETLHRYPRGGAMLGKVYKEAGQTFAKMMRKILLVNALLLIPASCLVVLLMGYVTYREIGDASISTFVLHVTAVAALIGAADRFMRTYSECMAGADTLWGIKQFLETGPSLRKEAAGTSHEGAAIVSFENVTYRYTPESKAVLNGVTIEIGQEAILLVGPNGAGKTSFLRLLARLDDASSGVVRLSGHDVKGLEPSDVKDMVAWLNQEDRTLPLTLRENILFGCPDSQGLQDAFADAIRLAGLQEILAERGLDTLIGEKSIGGVELSGGQKQRVYLARAICFAIVMRSPVLILDEPTTALDPIVIKDILSGILAFFRGRSTVIVVSHMFNLVGLVDRIVVLDHGLVVDQGSHAELMARCELYKQMFDAQAKGYTIS